MCTQGTYLESDENVCFLGFSSLRINQSLKQAIETTPRILIEQEKTPSVARKTKKKLRIGAVNQNHLSAMKPVYFQIFNKGSAMCVTLAVVLGSF